MMAAAMPCRAMPRLLSVVSRLSICPTGYYVAFVITLKNASASVSSPLIPLSLSLSLSLSPRPTSAFIKGHCGIVDGHLDF